MTLVGRYLAREISLGVLFVLFGFLGLFAFFDLVGELDDLGRGGLEDPGDDVTDVTDVAGTGNAPREGAEACVGAIEVRRDDRDEPLEDALGSRG